MKERKEMFICLEKNIGTLTQLVGNLNNEREVMNLTLFDAIVDRNCLILFPLLVSKICDY